MSEQVGAGRKGRNVKIYRNKKGRYIKRKKNGVVRKVYIKKGLSSNGLIQWLVKQYKNKGKKKGAKKADAVASTSASHAASSAVGASTASPHTGIPLPPKSVPVVDEFLAHQLLLQQQASDSKRGQRLAIAAPGGDDDDDLIVEKYPSRVEIKYPRSEQERVRRQMADLQDAPAKIKDAEARRKKAEDDREEDRRIELERKAKFRAVTTLAENRTTNSITHMKDFLGRVAGGLPSAAETKDWKWQDWMNHCLEIGEPIMTERYELALASAKKQLQKGSGAKDDGLFTDQIEEIMKPYSPLPFVGAFARDELISGVLPRVRKHKPACCLRSCNFAAPHQCRAVPSGCCRPG
jgi:hypothetical protein